jgi:hypothetical protein
MICTYEGGTSSSEIASELGFVIYTVNTIVNNAALMKGHVKGMAMMKSVITEKCEGAISEMGELLMMWMKAQIQKHVPFL